MRESPGKIILSWGLFFAVAWFARWHLDRVVPLCILGLTATLAAWALITLWRLDAERDWPKDRDEILDLGPLDRADPERAEWFVDNDGRIVDRNGHLVRSDKGS
jgi:hypothetical protein